MLLFLLLLLPTVAHCVVAAFESGNARSVQRGWQRCGDSDVCFSFPCVLLLLIVFVVVILANWPAALVVVLIASSLFLFLC